jgi:subtilisin family serine protease
MKHPRLFIILILFISPALLIAQSKPTEVMNGEYLISHYYSSIKPRTITSYSILESLPHSDVQLVAKNISSRLLNKRSSHSKRQKVLLDAKKVKEDCDEIMRDKSVRYCEPNYVYQLLNIPNDPFYQLQWGLNDPDFNYDIDAPEAWEINTGSDETIVAVLDTGINYRHKDLADNMWVNPREIPNNGIDDDNNFYVDDVHGADTYWIDGNPIDLDGHGSHVAGIIGARGNNGIGITGVNWNIKMIAVCAYDGILTSGFDSRSIVNGLNYIYGLKKFQGTNIVAVNASLGGYGFSQAQYDAIEKLRSVNVALVAAAGNYDGNNDYLPMYPAGYNLDNIVSVAATESSGAVSSFSNYGVNSVDLAAPGDAMTSTWASFISSKYSDKCAGSGDEIYCVISGTSMAAPMVTGALGLLYSQRGHLSYSKLIDILYNYSFFDPYYAQLVRTGRLLNIAGMLSSPALPDSCPQDVKKVEPGLCGCGIPDSYVDTDADGAVNCLDACPSDFRKTSAGSCGCGIQDIDLNGNNIADCMDIKVQSLLPSAPKVKSKKKSLTFSLLPQTGVKYYIRLEITQPTPKGKKKKTKIVYYSSDYAEGVIQKLKSGTTVQFSYGYMLDGTVPQFSSFSSNKKVKIK